jgi:hypothetical protein
MNIIPEQYNQQIQRMSLLMQAIRSYSTTQQARTGISQYAVECALNRYYKTKQLLTSVRYGRKIVSALIRIEGESE